MMTYITCRPISEPQFVCYVYMLFFSPHILEVCEDYLTRSLVFVKLPCYAAKSMVLTFPIVLFLNRMVKDHWEL
jgi:hypothetical protein